MTNIAATTQIRTHLDVFEEQGVGHTKNLPQATTDLPYPNFGTVAHSTYSEYWMPN